MLTIRNGFTLLSDLSGTSFRSLDHATHRLLLATLQDRYPARVSQILVINPSIMTSTLLRVARPFMKRKLLSKVRGEGALSYFR